MTVEKSALLVLSWVSNPSRTENKDPPLEEFAYRVVSLQEAMKLSLLEIRIEIYAIIITLTVHACALQQTVPIMLHRSCLLREGYLT